MTTDDFITKWNNKGCDWDNYYGNQCMDLANQYNEEVVGAPRLTGNAVDVWTTYPKNFYTQVKNTPDNAPSKGDILIWGQGVGPYGHIAVCTVATSDSFTSFDQNWPLNSVCHFQPHNYTNVLGWLHPKSQIVDTPPQLQPVWTDQTKIPIGGSYGDVELQALKSLLKDKDQQLGDLKAKVAEQSGAIDQVKIQAESLRVQLEELKNTPPKEVITDKEHKFKSTWIDFIYQFLLKLDGR